MIPFYLKKWYFDVVSHEGDVLYFYFITARIAGVPQGIVSAHLITGEGREARALEKTPFASESGGSLRLGRHAFFLADGGVEAHLEFKNLNLNLVYSPRLGPWRSTESGVLLARDDRTSRALRWHVPVPSARVKGVISLNGHETPVVGEGYLDIVETDIPAWRLPLAELHWGRAHFAEQTLVFNQIKTRRGELIQNLLLTETPPDSGSEKRQRAVFDDQNFTLQADPQDAAMSLSRGSAFALCLTGPKVIEESPVVTAERFKSKAFRRVLKRLTGGPIEKKVVSRARLEFDGKTVLGTALYERVSWHWPKEG
jgi:hypothetical protein